MWTYTLLTISKSVLHSQECLLAGDENTEGSPKSKQIQPKTKMILSRPIGFSEVMRTPTRNCKQLSMLIQSEFLKCMLMGIARYHMLPISVVLKARKVSLLFSFVLGYPELSLDPKKGERFHFALEKFGTMIEWVFLLLVTYLKSNLLNNCHNIGILVSSWDN